MAEKKARDFHEFTKACADAGYGEVLPKDYNDSEPVIVAGGIMPKWMAEVYGHIGRKKEKSNGETNA